MSCVGNKGEIKEEQELVLVSHSIGRSRGYPVFITAINFLIPLANFFNWLISESLVIGMPVIELSCKRHQHAQTLKIYSPGQHL